ncbi:MAG: hypothetical protein M0R80_14735 [Proteobacteria bacterium]|jgi:hypothetical protein|nr:hypothetical protein [Pseudomonadota bacterium]
MKIRTFGRSTLLLASAAVVAACSGEESNEAGDTETECECTSNDDNYCSSADYAMECLDGCHFTEKDCDVADCSSGCADGECWVEEGCCGESATECTEVGDSYCEGTMLVECLPDDPCWNHGVTECLDDLSCPCGSGCTEGPDGAYCWCCQSDAGVGDAGTDAGE